MQIAELFVTLGIKGAEKTVGALGEVKKGLGGIASMSLEAKAGILAAMYGLERMMSVSGAAGTGFTNFSALTGFSAQALQKWQYAARQAGESNEEFTGSLKSVQNAMTNMLLGKGAPEGLGIVTKAVGFDPKRARDSFYVMEQLQKAAQALPKDVGNNVLKSFGLSEGTIAAMRRNAFNPAAFAKAPAYSDKEIQSLDKSNIAWSNLGTQIQMAFGHFNAKHGQQLVNDISKIVTAVMKLTDALTILAEKLDVFGKLKDALSFIGDNAKGASNLITAATSKDPNKTVLKAISDNNKKNSFDNMWDDALTGAIKPKPQFTPAIAGAASTTVNTTVHNHGVKDAHEATDHMKKAINHAVRTNPAQKWGG
jgi:hypothetical protein